MREIKFRAWDEKLKKFHYSGLECLANDHGYLFEGDGSAHPDFFEFGCNFEELKIEQYTGLKDKNSVKIFEGDILDGGFNRLLVFWEEGSFLVKHIDDGGFMCGHDLCCYCNTRAIIGNIHDNG